ncbi:MAG: multicopper oxidase domain-containing protein [Bacteroidia bacterium]
MKKIKKCYSCFLVFILLYGSVHAQKVVRYDLYISDTIVNYTGRSVKAIAINGQIPGPTLYFTEGDTAEIYVHNHMCMETSIHWHGILLPDKEDGVPYLTYPPIKPHQTYMYKFPIIQSGTYWYHSHTCMQEQSGLHGALIIHKRNETPMPEYVVFLNDWTNEKPEEVLRSLKTANDWYSIKKHSTQNWGEALVTGNFGVKAKQEWLRMQPMDVSDVYYNAFQLNGRQEQKLAGFKAGDKVKLRIINGSSSTYFWLQYAGGKMSVVASDGHDIVPVEADRMIIAIAETYDVIITIPDDKNYEFRATSEDRTGFSSLWLGNGTKVSAPTLPKLDYFEGMKTMNSMMKFNGSMDNMGMQMSMQQMDMNIVMYPELHGTDTTKSKAISILNYSMLRSPEKTTLPNVPTTTLKFNLTGNMNRYQWEINDLPISEADKISIKKGDNVRIVLYNNSMMRHPMHIHGHYFRLLNGQGDYAPLKNVLDIMPMETDTIEFNANADGGDWFMHCHILYHMMSGMGRVFSYDNKISNPPLDSIKDSYMKFLMDDKGWYFTAGASLQSQAIYGNATIMDRYYQFDAMGALNYTGEYISETHFGRFLDKQQFLKVYIGTDIRNLTNSVNNIDQGMSNYLEKREVAVAGIQYMLPFFLQTELRVDNTGRVRFQLSRQELALTSRLRLDGMVNTDKEYEVGLHYIITKRISVSANYDSDFGMGGGITFTY